MVLILALLLACKKSGKDIHKAKLVEKTSVSDEEYTIKLPEEATGKGDVWTVVDPKGDIEMKISVLPNTVMRDESYFKENMTITSSGEILGRFSSPEMFYIIDYEVGPPNKVQAIVYLPVSSYRATGCVGTIVYKSSGLADGLKQEQGEFLKRICGSVKPVKSTK